MFDGTSMTLCALDKVVVVDLNPFASINLSKWSEKTQNYNRWIILKVENAL